ncbi:peptidase U32 family protein [Psychromonas ossibalaenae]|uniref:peptidase U32 family protein n=1 Tax=Psychromonas ossibalaenae TaxID=444922 RepID=UPI000370278A|nr:peptidase U32 family protein [Psychromonas ossibalaenae]
MNKKIELLAPGGDLDSIKAAIAAGADAVYCGLDSFNARKRAVNLSFDDLNRVIKLAHQHNCEVFLTLNIIILENELKPLLTLLNKLVNTAVDGVIVQDLGLFYLLSEHFPTLDIHASTQVTTHNEGQILFLNKLGASRVNLSRELSIKEIKSLTQFGLEYNVLSEVFVHGSYCIGFSGLCYISSAHGGNSGNRGRCSQPCRDKYVPTAAGKEYPLNLKDNSAFFDLEALIDAGVYSLKIEGRIKGSSYVHTVVSSWKKQLQSFSGQGKLLTDNSALYKVFNRDFSNAYLKGTINKLMFIDNPRDNTLKHVEQSNAGLSELQIQQAKQDLYDQKTAMATEVADKIKLLDTDKTPLTITLSGQPGELLYVSVSTPESIFMVRSKSKLIHTENASINQSALDKRWKGLNNALTCIESICMRCLDEGLFIPFKELTVIKNTILFLLNGSKDAVTPVELPALSYAGPLTAKAKLAVLISSEQDISLCCVDGIDVYYKLPDSFRKGCAKYVELFLKNKGLIPWFPSVLIGADYEAAAQLLKQVSPEKIVTNNTGIAYLAYQLGIDWTAGPYLNTTNSFSLACLKQKFNCSGAFISNEINKKQIKAVSSPENFQLYYSIYHPLLLLSSRQCLFHQTVGCKKAAMDAKCLDKCEKSASIINLKGTSFAINKQKGDYANMYSNEHFLNTDIVNDAPGQFSAFFIDLTDIGITEQREKDKTSIIRGFIDLIDGSPDAAGQLHNMLGQTTNSQYQKGL